MTKTTSSKYKGMTVNERLYVAGLLDEFNAAEERKDANHMIEILEIVELNDEAIRANLEFSVLDPNLYKP